MEVPYKTEKKATYIIQKSYYWAYIKKKKKKTNLKRHMYSNVLQNTIHKHQDMDKPKYPLTDEWIKKMCTYTQWTIACQ